MWLFRRPEKAQDPGERHDTVLDLIEQVTALRGRLRAQELEWDDMRAQIKKGYQRMEKAYERSMKAPPCPEEEPTPVDGAPSANSFADKYRQMSIRI